MSNNTLDTLGKKLPIYLLLWSAALAALGLSVAVLATGWLVATLAMKVDSAADLAYEALLREAGLERPQGDVEVGHITAGGGSFTPEPASSHRRRHPQQSSTMRENPSIHDLPSINDLL